MPLTVMRMRVESEIFNVVATARYSKNSHYKYFVNYFPVTYSSVSNFYLLKSRA